MAPISVTPRGSLKRCTEPASKNCIGELYVSDIKLLYAVSGRLEIYFSVTVEAESEEAAEEFVKDMDYSDLAYTGNIIDLDINTVECLNGDDE